MSLPDSDELKTPELPPKPSEDPFSIVVWCVTVLTAVLNLFKSFFRAIVEIFKKCKCKNDKKDEKDIN